MNEEVTINYIYEDNKIFISSPKENKNQNIKLTSKIELEPFYMDATIDINNKDINFLIDNFLFIILNSKEYLGNINGKLTLDFNYLKNSIIDSGKIIFSVKEKKIRLESSLFEINGIGKLKSDFRYYENEGDLIFASENIFEIIDKKEFSRKFQLRTKNIKNINRIFFDLEKNIDSEEISISNVYFNKIDMKNFSEEYYTVKNFQILKGLLRNLFL